MPDSSQLEANFKLDYRKKGLLWYSTYKVFFSGEYRFVNPKNHQIPAFFEFYLPEGSAVYDNLQVLIDGKRIEDAKLSQNKITLPLKLKPRERTTVKVSYKSQGQDEWRYNFSQNYHEVSKVKDFSFTMTTNFKEIDFPGNCLSPTFKTETQKGWKLKWNYEKLLSGAQVGLLMPKKLNPGPWVSKITFFAPIPLLFFFFLVFIFSLLKKVKIHPMNYFFLAAAFFSFHLLLAYLADQIDINLAFLISSLVSIFLVVSYMRIVTGERFAFVEVGISQFVYLVVFSYTFFFEGYTGLAITIMSIITLFIIMQLTANVDWEEVFRKAATKPGMTSKLSLTKKTNRQSDRKRKK